MEESRYSNVGAGEGTTATRSLAGLLRNHFNMSVLHWNATNPSTEKLMTLLFTTPPAASTTLTPYLADLDFPKLLQHCDAVLDTVPQLFPFIII